MSNTPLPLNDNRLLLTFYGDDFTGSTDSLEALAKGGLRAALFLEPPKPEQLQGRFANLQAVGVAGISRSLTPAQMEAEVRPRLAQLKRLGAPLCHYKTCSTFDSSPQIGSIGRAIDIGAEVYESTFVPMIIGAPALKRYMVFGNLFATVDGQTYRLDRHPTMSQHPITPMDEGDLRLHLAKQTHKSIALMDVLHLAGSQAEVDRRFQTLLQRQPDILFFDILDDTHLATAGRLIWENKGDRPLFVVGSSGVEYALVAHWQRVNLIEAPGQFSWPGAVEQIVVVSGSASPSTAGQISWALDNGFVGIRADAKSLIDPSLAAAEGAAITQQALMALGQGRSVVVYAARGSNDPAIKAAAYRLKELGLDPAGAGRWLGEQLGAILRTLVERTGLRRVCVAGGDTSSYAARQLGIYALEVLTPTAPGSPLCRASAHQARFDGLEIVLKGGQVGPPSYFGQVLQGQL